MSALAHRSDANSTALLNLFTVRVLYSQQNLMSCVAFLDFASSDENEYTVTAGHADRGTATGFLQIFRP